MQARPASPPWVATSLRQGQIWPPPPLTRTPSRCLWARCPGPWKRYFFYSSLKFQHFIFNYPVGSSKRCVVINVHFIQKLVTYLKSSFQDELQEFFSEFGPVHQLNILRDKTSGVSRQEKCRFQTWSCVSCFSGGAVLSPTSTVEMPWRHKTDFTTSRSYPG